MNIRQGTQNDILKVSRLWLKMATELEPGSTPNIEWWRRLAVSYFNSGAYAMFLAEDGGSIIGFGDFFISPEPLTGKIHWLGRHLFVNTEHRKSEVAGNIYRAGLRFGKKNGATVFDVFCSHNETSLWKKKGYEEVSFVMRKR